MLWKKKYGKSFSDAIGDLRVPFAMILYGALAAPYPMALTGYHICLMARGETTREYVSFPPFLGNLEFTISNFCSLSATSCPRKTAIVHTTN